MLLNFLKLLAFFWPFFKSVLFKDRPVKEVLHANRQFTYLFLILIGLATMLYATASTLADTRQALSATHREVNQLERQLGETERRLARMRETIDDDKDECRSSDDTYNKDHLLRLLRE